MKIAIVCPDGRSLLLFCKGIINCFKNIKDADVYTLSAEGPYKKEIESLGVKSINIDMYRFFSINKDLKILIALYRIFTKEKFDIVYNLSTKPNIYGSLAARMANVNCIISHVVGLGSAFLLTGLKGKLVKTIYIKLYQLAAKFNSKIWFFNKNDLEYFISNSLIKENKVLLTKSCLDIDYYSQVQVSKEQITKIRTELELKEIDKVVLMIARLIWPKGIKEFIEAAEIIKDKDSTIKFLLIAPPEEGNYDEVPVSYVTNKCKILPNFKWLQYVDDLRPYYALSHIKVLPSYYKEGGHPRSMLEAMAMGKPIITTDNKDCCDAVENGRNGYLVPIKNSNALAQTIFSLINDDKKILQFGKYSRKKIECEFDEKKVVTEGFKQLGLFKTK